MGSIDLPQVEPMGNKSLEEYVRYLANMIATQQEEIQNLLEGRISTNNVREIAGWLVSKSLMQSKDKDVGMSTEDTAADDIRFFAGPDGAGGWKFYVTKGGKLFAIDGEFQGKITGSTVIGSEIKTSETGYPRVELSSLNKLLQAFLNATNSIYISPSYTGNPSVVFDNGTIVAFMAAVASTMAINAQTGTLQLWAQAGDLLLKAGGGTKKVKFDSWTDVLNVLSGNTLQQDLNSKANASVISGTVYVSSTSGGAATTPISFTNGVRTS